jgi:cytochrome P450
VNGQSALVDSSGFSEGTGVYGPPMTTSELTLQTVLDQVPIPTAGPAFHVPDVGWVVTRHSEASAVLADPGFAVHDWSTTGPVGSIEWLRSSVSRFTNGSEHQLRRARVCGVLAELPPEVLREEAHARSLAVLENAKSRGQIDVMADLARRIPMEVLADRLGFADADRAVDAVVVTAAAYFPGAGAAQERAADLSTAELVSLLEPADEELIAAKIAVIVQGCDATAALIGKAVCWALPPNDDHAAWPTDALVAEVARYDPPLRVTRRVSRAGAQVAGAPVAVGSAVLLRVDAANRDPEVFETPATFDPDRRDGPNLTFGYGLRPCPGQAHALALASGAVQAVRDRCSAVLGDVEYKPPVDLRIPARVTVGLQ